VSSVVDVWRAIDPAARLLAGVPEDLLRPVRGIARARAAPPHLPALADGELLLVDAQVAAAATLDALLDALLEAGLDLAAVTIGGARGEPAPPTALRTPPLIVSATPTGELEAAARRYLSEPAAVLERSAFDLRLAMAEAALVEPAPSTPAGLAAERLRRGVAVAAEGQLVSVHPRPAGTALAVRFTATFYRLLRGRRGQEPITRTSRDGLWLEELRIHDDASAWLFDDLPFAAVDLVAASALATTLRALLRRPRQQPPVAEPTERPVPVPPRTGDLLRETLVAVARANGRVAPAARALGVHRNTVLYRLRQARSELGLDPRRPEDALRVLRDAQRSPASDDRR
jgi:hypothetical protein